MTEVKFDYVKTFLLNEIARPRESILEEFLKRDIGDAEFNLHAAEELNQTGLVELKPLRLEGPKVHRKRAEKALENLEDVDFVFYWGDGYITRLLSDEDISKVRLYGNKFENPCLRPSRDVAEYLDIFEDLGFEVKGTIEDDVEPYWFDFYGFLSPEEAKKYYGEENVRT